MRGASLRRTSSSFPSARNSEKDTAPAVTQAEDASEGRLPLGVLRRFWPQRFPEPRATGDRGRAPLCAAALAARSCRAARGTVAFALRFRGRQVKVGGFLSNAKDRKARRPRLELGDQRLVPPSLVGDFRRPMAGGKLYRYERCRLVDPLQIFPLRAPRSWPWTSGYRARGRTCAVRAGILLRPH